MRYFLKIEDCDENGAPVGRALPVIAEGEFSGGVLTLDYIFDNAHYNLKVSENCVYHSRFGDTEMRLEFRQGELTSGMLNGEGVSGNFDIFTRELAINLTPNGCSVRVKFSESADDGEIIVKNIIAYLVR